MTLAVVALGAAIPASAQVVQSFGAGVGLFLPRGYDSRVDGDVLVADLTQPLIPGLSPPSTSSLNFDIGDFRAWPIFGEWNVGIGRHIEVSGGLSWSSKKVNSVYADLVNGAKNNAEIEQQLRLRMIPITGVVRFLPFGDATGVQPYVGAGITTVHFKYTEAGEFVDLADLTVFPDRFTATGWATGPVILGGVRFPIGGDVYALTLEGRYQFLDGATGGAANNFLGDRIDLSGGLVNFGFLVRF